MPKIATDETATKQRRAAALARIQRLQARVSARNRDLTPEQAERIAEVLNRAALKRLEDRGEVVFERDRT